MPITHLALSGLADKTLGVSEGNDRGCGARSLGVLDHTWLRPLHDGNARVGRAQIDTDHRALDVVPIARVSGELHRRRSKKQVMLEWQ